MNPHELKALQTRLSKARADEASKKETMQAAQQDYEQSRTLVKHLEKEIESNTVKDPIVSEHALLRYIQRLYGVDLDGISSQILTPSTVSAIKTLGNGKYPLASGGRAVVKENVIVSIVD